MRQILAAWVFYTHVPLPFIQLQASDFQRIARWLPVIGMGIGGLLGISDGGLRAILPDPLRAVGVLWAWISITGGFHLDGVADTADGLSVDAHDQEGLQRRLAVMSDSRVGALGVVAVGVVIMVKGAGVLCLSAQHWPYLVLTPVWGRWGQLMAITLYPYLKPTGQGRFLKDSTQPYDWIPMTLLGLAISGVLGTVTEQILPLMTWSLATASVSLLISGRFYRRLEGQTGDTYGAVVEWTEAMALLLAQVQIPLLNSAPY